jgi:hypothetical protein
MAITKILNIQEADDRNPAAHLKNAIEYIQNPDKTEKCVLVGSINCLPDTAFAQMMETKELYHKTGKRQGYHIIISFSPEEVVTPEQALYVMEHFAKDVLGDDYEAVYSVHTDKEHMHAHLIWNSVSLVTGKKYNSPKGNWKNKLQPITNKYCEEIGLSICPAEYSKNPVNMSRNEWEKEQEFKEFILRDAMFCALSAGSVEHFEFLMKKLGYEFQPGKYLRVKIPGRKIYHRLDKMHEMFEEGKLKHWVDMPWSAKPYFYSNNPRKIYRAGMSEYQKKYYAKMYRMRVVEHRRFDYKSAHYAEELRKFHRLQDEYLLLVKNDIKDIYGLLVFMENKKSEIKTIDDRQHEIYKENQRRKRKIATPEDMREYQSWHLSVEAELAELKETKKKAKYDYKLAGNVLREKTDSVQTVGLEKEEVMDADEVVMPEYGEPERETVESEYVGINKDEMLPSEMETAQMTPQQEVLEVQEIRAEHKIQAEQEIPEEELELSYEENLMSDRYDYSMESGNQNMIHFPAGIEEYQALSLETRLELQGIRPGINGDDVFGIVKENFDKAGYAAIFDELYKEVSAIKKYLEKQQYRCSIDGIVGKFREYSSYDSVPLSVKVDVFAFGFNNASENLDIYMKVLKQLGVKMDQEAIFEDYQAIYDETVKRQERQEDRWWNRDKKW